MKYVFIILLSIFIISCAKVQDLKPISVEKSSSSKITTQYAPVKNYTNETEKSAREEPEKEAKQKESAEVATSDVDSDNDGVLNQNDQCTETSNGFIIDNKGCPQTSAPHIKFASKRFDVTDEIIEELEELASFLKENKNYQVIIYGYTDSVGDELKNKILSQKRAKAVKKGLIAHGVSATKLTAIGKGEENPIADNADANGREKNRRIEIELIE